MSDRVSRPSLVLLLTALVVANGVAQSPSGALRISLDPTACRAAGSIELVRVTTRPISSGGYFKDFESVGHNPVTEDCAWALDAVAPGEYEVWFQQASVKLAVRPVTVGPGETANVSLTNEVLVTGSVLLNGAPFRGIAVEFAQQHGSHRLLAEAVTDTTGSYQVFLADESPFTVVFWREKAVVLGQSQEGVAHRGVNRMDWLLEGATLRVMPVGWDHKQPISLLIERKGPGTGHVYGVGVQADPDHLPVTLLGLAFGTYEMRWMAEDDHPREASEPVTVNLDAQNSERVYELALRNAPTQP